MPLGPDCLVVTVVRRAWGTSTPLGEVRTNAPAAVEVRREPPAVVAEPGGMSARAARHLAEMLVVAAKLAEAPPADAATGAPPRRRRAAR